MFIWTNFDSFANTYLIKWLASKNLYFNGGYA